METHTIFFTGKPGSGKGTQAKLLSEKTGWRIVAASGLLRSLAGEDTTIGRKIRSDMSAGILVPSWLPMHLFLDTVLALPNTENVIFDGFSRKMQEAELVVDALTWIERPFTVFYLRTADDEIRRRITLRREVEGRADDHDHIVEKRFEEYYANTEPTIELFKKAGVLVEIDGERAPEEIAADIRAKLSIA